MCCELRWADLLTETHLLYILYVHFLMLVWGVHTIDVVYVMVLDNHLPVFSVYSSNGVQYSSRLDLCRVMGRLDSIPAS